MRYAQATPTSLAEGIAGIEHSSARQSHRLRTVSATLTPASKCECGVRANTGARQAPDATMRYAQATPTSLAIRSHNLVTQLGEPLLQRGSRGFKPCRGYQIMGVSPNGLGIDLLNRPM